MRKVLIPYSCPHLDGAIEFIQSTDMDGWEYAIAELEKARKIHDQLRKLAQEYGEEADKFESELSNLQLDYDQAEEVIKELEEKVDRLEEKLEQEIY